MTKNEMILNVAVGLLGGASTFLFHKVITNGEEIATLRAQMAEAQKLDKQLGSLTEQLRLLTAEVAGVKVTVARVETKLEAR